MDFLVDFLEGGEAVVSKADVQFLCPHAGPTPGFLILTNFRLCFIPSQSNKTPSSADAHPIGPIGPDVPVACVQRIEKLGGQSSRGEHAYGIEVQCKDLRTLRFSFVAANHSRRSIYENLFRLAFPYGNSSSSTSSASTSSSSAPPSPRLSTISFYNDADPAGINMRTLSSTTSSSASPSTSSTSALAIEATTTNSSTLASPSAPDTASSSSSSISLPGAPAQTTSISQSASTLSLYSPSVASSTEITSPNGTNVPAINAASNTNTNASVVSNPIANTNSNANPGNDLFAFSYRPSFLSSLDVVEDGWNVYDATTEFARMGLPNKQWRLSKINANYSLCDTYPSVICVPETVPDETLTSVASFRSRGRLPVLSWIHPRTGAVIMRSSQPRVGVAGRRSADDEAMLEAIRRASSSGEGSSQFTPSAGGQESHNTGGSSGSDQSKSNSSSKSDSNIVIMDARPKTNAVANQARGAGYENVNLYEKAEIHFLNIANIHVMRESLKRLQAICFPEIDDAKWLSNLERTRWLDHVRLVLGASVRVAHLIDRRQQAVLVHCSDGWDRTAQMTSLAMLMLDPFYRTLRGFAVLIEKEWLSFGHKFAQRVGHGSKDHADEQRAPIFFQFLDCCWQLLVQFPAAFEFNESLLMFLADELYSCRFGTFLCNSEQERVEANLRSRTVSIWTYVLHHAPALFLNHYYQPHSAVHNNEESTTLYPNYSLRRLQVWDYYVRWGPSSLANIDIMTPSQNKNMTDATLSSTGTASVPSTLAASSLARQSFMVSKSNSSRESAAILDRHAELLASRNKLQENLASIKKILSEKGIDVEQLIEDV